MSSLYDGLGGEELQISGLQFSGTNLYISPYFLGSLTTESDMKAINVYGTTVVSGPTVLGTTYSGTNYYEASKGLLHSVIVNSGTAVYGAKIIAGSGVLGAGSNVWITYPVAFTSTPTVIATNNKTIAKVVNTGSFGIGSFYAEGEAAADNFSWIAVGL